MNSKQSSPMVTIIIPIYNSSKYLSRCLESIINQTHLDYEALLIDDESTDSSLDICRSYSKKDSRFVTIHKKNEGVSAARNTGLKLAKGEYISFIDSDDYVEKTFIEELLNLAVTNNADIAACDFQKVFSKVIAIKNNDDSTIVDIYGPIESVKDVLSYNTRIDVVLWNKIYKKSLFINNSIKFPIGRIMEDSARIHELVYFANKVVRTNKRLYYYMQRKTGNITSSRFNQRLGDALKVIDDQKNFIKKHNPNLNNNMLASEITTKLGMINVLIDQGEAVNEEWQNLRLDIIKKTKRYLSDPLIHNRQKISIILLTSGEQTYRIYRKLFLFTKQLRYGSRV